MQLLAPKPDSCPSPLTRHKRKRCSYGRVGCCTCTWAAKWIRTTAEHPFFTQSGGWRAACQLEAGELLSSHDGRSVAVEEVYDTGQYQTVYNLRVQDYHTYFVGAED